MKSFADIFSRLEKSFLDVPLTVTSLLLIAIALGLIGIAIFNHNIYFRAFAIAYILLP
jgi:hypothetical protein